eukprot:530488-Rhodomonas_salina.3
MGTSFPLVLAVATTLRSCTSSDLHPTALASPPMPVASCSGVHLGSNLSGRIRCARSLDR